VLSASGLVLPAGPHEEASLPGESRQNHHDPGVAAEELVCEPHARPALDLEQELTFLEAGREVPGDRDAGGRRVQARLDDDAFRRRALREKEVGEKCEDRKSHQSGSTIGRRDSRRKVARISSGWRRAQRLPDPGVRLTPP
jgi:hypothetical protein